MAYFRRSSLLILIALSLALMPRSSSAQSSSLASAIDSYIQATWGVTSDVMVYGYNQSNCNGVCRGALLLVTYAEGDAVGQAVVRLSDHCPTCYTVLIAGGGEIDVPGIESLGISPTIAQQLVVGNH